MSFRLTKAQMGRLDNCSCPWNHHTQSAAFKYALRVTFVMAVIAEIAFTVFIPAIAIALLVVFLLGALGTLAFRLIRGHTLACAVRWGLIGGFGWLTDGLLSSF